MNCLSSLLKLLMNIFSSSASPCLHTNSGSNLKFAFKSPNSYTSFSDFLLLSLSTYSIRCLIIYWHLSSSTFFSFFLLRQCDLRSIIYVSCSGFCNIPASFAPIRSGYLSIFGSRLMINSTNQLISFLNQFCVSPSRTRFFKVCKSSSMLGSSVF